MPNWLIVAAVAFAAGVVAGAAAAYWYLEDDFAQQQRLLMTLHGTNRATACAQPPDRRPKGLDCQGIGP
jgi:hypothetical protein